MERLDAHIGAIDSALQQAPEILQTIRVDTTVNVLHRMVHNFMGIVGSKSAIAKHLIGVERCSRLHMLFDQWLNGFLLRDQGELSFAPFRRAPEVRKLQLCPCLRSQ